MRNISLFMVCLTVVFAGCFMVVKSAFAEIDVETTFQTVCVLCHGDDGKGSDQGKKFGVPDFTDKEWQAETTDEYMIKRMIEGSDNPNYGEGVLPLLEMIGVENPEDEVPSLVPMIRSFGK